VIIVNWHAEKLPWARAFGPRQSMRQDHISMDGLGDVHHVCSAVSGAARCDFVDYREQQTSYLRRPR
jgi:hypothetical protein